MIDTLTDITIRLAEDKECEQLFEIWKPGLINSFHTDKLDMEKLRMKFFENFRNRTGIFNYWVALSHGEIVGWQSITRSTSHPAKSDHYGESSTYIAPHVHNKGIAGKLIRHVMNLARQDEQLYYVTAYVSVNNQGARKLAASVGFREVGEIPASSHEYKKVFLALNVA